MTNSASIEKQFYVTGGTLPPNTPSYIRRQADEELYRRVLAGEFCYVLTPRQMGKSSLMAQTAKRLQTGPEQIHSAIIDLTKIGTDKAQSSAAQWYYGIAHAIVRSLGLQLDPPLTSWWAEQTLLPPLQRLSEFFDLLLANTTGGIVIFVDEIDTTIALPFSDDFFAAIRSCYNQRATNSTYERLTFVLLGVATPSDLMKDNARTPFNIGGRIDLTDFSPQEAKPLAQGLDHDSTMADLLLARILYWTNGHPYLTQKVCDLLSTVPDRASSDNVVDRLVEKHYLSPEANRAEYNLAFVRDRLMGANRRREVLQLYRNIVTGKKIVDDPLSPLHSTLKLSGLVVPDTTGTQHIRNRIYQAVFTADWATGALPRDTNRYVVIGAILLLLMGAGTWYTQFLPQAYIDALQTASEDYPDRAYEALKGIPGYSEKADSLLADYWTRRSNQFQVTGDRDKALWAQVKSLTVVETDQRRREVNLLVGADYHELLNTYRQGVGVIAVAFSPDGKLALTGSVDGSVRLWRTDTGAPVGTPLHHEATLKAVAFSPDGQRILTGTGDGTTFLWDSKTGAQIGAPHKHEGPIATLAFSPDGKRILTGTENGSVRLSSTETRAAIGPILKHGERITAVAFSPDGKRVLTGSDDRTARLWDADTGAPVGALLKHNSFVRAVAFSPDGERILTGTGDGTTFLWDSKTGARIGAPHKHEGLVTTVAFSPDGKFTLTGNLGGTTRLWQTSSGIPVGPLRKHDEAITTATFSPDGTQILTGSLDGIVRLWRIETEASLDILLKNDEPITAVAFSPNGKFALTGDLGGTTRLWQTLNHSTIGAVLKHENSVWAVAFSPNSTLALTGSRDRTARLWNTETGLPIGPSLEHESSVWAVAFSPDGKRILTGSENGNVRLWQTDSNNPVGPLFKHESSVWAVAFSPDGKRILTGSDDGSVRLWNTETGAVMGQILKHDERITAVAFSPDGKRILTGSGDRTARLWDADTGRPLGPSLKYGGHITGVAFSKDCRRVILAIGFWVLALDISNDELIPIKARLLPGISIEGLNILDPQGNQVQVAVKPITDGITIQTLRFDAPEEPPILGEPTALLQEWGGKLALTFENGKIVPLYPISVITRGTEDRSAPKAPKGLSAR